MGSCKTIVPNVGIGTTTPSLRLSIGDASANDGGFIAHGYGAVGTGQTLTATGAGKRLFWYPKKAAFRSGGVDTANPNDTSYAAWDDSNIGNYSTAIGLGNIASGTSSFSGGRYSTATGNYAMSYGFYSYAVGDSSLSLGETSVANGTGSIAIGTGAASYGDGAAALGTSSRASGAYSVVLGRKARTGTGYAGSGGNYSMAIGLGDPAGAAPYVSGTSSLGIFMGDQSGMAVTSDNVMAILGGNVGIGTSTPASKLHVVGAINSEANTIASGAAVDLSLSNTHVLQSVGGSTITLSNMVNGGVYTLFVQDQTVRTYTFSGCATAKFSPLNAATTASTDTVYGITTLRIGGAWTCYITWSSGFQ